MTRSICFKCGEEKSNPLVACPTCNEVPKHESALALSLVLSEHLSTRAELVHFAHEIRNHLKLSAPTAKLNEAREALNDSQLMAMLGAVSQSKDSSKSNSPSATQGRQMTGSPVQMRNRSSAQRSMNTSDLHRNPFSLLGVTSRDDRKRIVEQAEEKSLELDHDQCQKARSDLTSPRNRLTAEIGWLPGVSPRKASQLLDALLGDAMSIRSETGIPTLARCNLMAAAFESVNPSDSAEELAAFIQEMANLVEELSVDEIARDINEDRSISGFPEIRSSDLIETEISERKRYFKSCIKEALNKLPPESLLKTMTLAVDGATDGGDDHAPELIDELVDSYAVEVQGILEREGENVQKLIQAARSAVNSGQDAVKPHIEKIERVARNWDKFAQPIQLSAKARGIDHEASRALAYDIRSLAIDLFNKHDMLALSQRLTALIRDIFSEIPEVSERVQQDADALDGIAADRNKLAEKFKDFSLSGNFFKWKDRSYDISTISHIGFYRAITTHKTNFVETGKTERATLTLNFDNGQTLNISIDEQGFFWNKNRTQQIQAVADFYGFLLNVTFDRRLKSYESQIERNGYWVYDECQFHPHKKVVFRGKDFEISSSSFLKSYGCIELRKKDYGVLDKLKREVTLTKIPQFSTITDADVIFHMLDKHMGLRWS